MQSGLPPITVCRLSRICVVHDCIPCYISLHSFGSAQTYRSSSTKISFSCRLCKLDAKLMLCRLRTACVLPCNMHHHVSLVHAAAALLPQLQLSSQDLAELCGSLPCSLADAAAAVHGSASRLPLPAKLASCRLLANLLPSQEMADAVLPPLAGGLLTPHSASCYLCHTRDLYMHGTHDSACSICCCKGPGLLLF